MPIVSDLDAAMMQPGFSVPAVRRLGGGTIRLNDAGRPLRAVGRDAVIYELRTPTGRILALRCLLRPDAQRESVLGERYTALGADPSLEPLRRAGGALPREIRWIEEGIALPGPDLHTLTAPVAAMERVPGRTLIRTVDRLCREEQTDPLALLADRWLETATLLEESAFSHGDLAADNLIVRPDGAIALVDLDTATWPTAPIPAGLSGGTPGYTHPRGAPLDPTQRDRFPALMIWASLRVLARHPGLRERWGDPPDRHGAALLWSVDTLRRGARSPLFSALEALQDETLAPLLEIVQRALRFAADDTPPLPEIAERLEQRGFPRSADPRTRGPRRGWTPAVAPAAFAEVIPALDGTDQRLDGTETILGPRLVPRERDERHPDASRTTTLAERDRRRAAAKQLGEAVAARDTDAVTRLWQETRTIPEAATYAAAVHHLRAQESAAAIDRAIRRRDDEGVLTAVADAERAGVAPSHEARTASRRARERIAARAALQEAIVRDDLHALATLARLGKLECLGRLDPATTRTIRRALAWPTLERALLADNDDAIIAAADPALWREEGSLPLGAGERIELARTRLRWAEDIRGAIRRRDGAVLRGLLASAPPGAEKRLTEVESRRILRLSMREAAVARLERALRQGPDREVVAALAEFEAAAAPFSDVLDWTAVRGVVDRISLAEALRAAAEADPPDTSRLARLLPAARVALGDLGNAGEPNWVELERSVLRAAHLARLREAIAAGDDARIASAADPDPYGTRSVLTPDERERVEQALTRGKPSLPPLARSSC